MRDVPIQGLGGVADPERQGGGVVDARVPRPPLQRREIACVAVARQFLDLARPVLRAAAAVEHGDLVPPGKGVAHLMRSDEARAAEDQQAHRARRRRRCAGVKGDRREGDGGERAA